MRNPITQYGKPVAPFFMLGEHYGRKTIETWRDATTPRTERPVRFVYLSNERAYRPRLARGYMQSVYPVHFPA